MKKISIAFLSALMATVPVMARETVSMNLGWEFEDGQGNRSKVDLPHDYQISQPWVAPEAGDNGNANDPAANIKSRLSSRGFKEMGKGTYRKTLNVPDSLKGKRVILDFEGIMLTG
ncbi:MAG: beta-galactosidase, partial [Muribaculaceae bacterium]|nr:beta-galactosidase [Muribaculaceae bacterium]